jgi:hypothetical protein
MPEFADTSAKILRDFFKERRQYKGNKNAE